MSAPAFSVELTAAEAAASEQTIQFRFPTKAAARKALLAEAKAWREIARRVGQRGLLASGLCFEVSAARFGYREPATLSGALACAMDRRITEHLGDDSYIVGYCGQDTLDAEADPHHRQNTRVLAALFLALECESEAAALSSSLGKPRRKKGVRHA